MLVTNYLTAKEENEKVIRIPPLFPNKNANHVLRGLEGNFKLNRWLPADHGVKMQMGYELNLLERKNTKLQKFENTIQ